MRKPDTTQLEKLRKEANEKRAEVYKLVTLVTHGDEGRDTVMDAVKAYAESQGKLSSYEENHRGVVGYLAAKEEKEREERFPYFGSDSYLRMMCGLPGLGASKKSKKKSLKVQRP